jgi:hypothetical protein
MVSAPLSIVVTNGVSPSVIAVVVSFAALYDGDHPVVIFTVCFTSAESANLP